MLRAEVIIKTSDVDRNNMKFDVTSFTPEMLEKLRLAHGASEVQIVGDKLIASMKPPVELTENVRIRGSHSFAGQLVSEATTLVIHSPHPDEFALVDISKVVLKSTLEESNLVGREPMRMNKIGDFFGTPLSDETDVELLKVIIDKLFGILDDIDTSSDVLKPRCVESYRKFYEATMRRVAKRHELVASDGYALFIVKDETKPSIMYHPV